MIINGRNPHLLSRSDTALFRRRELGFVFQHFNLLDTLTVEENIVLPLTLEGMPLDDMGRLSRIADRLDIGSILHKHTYEISGGQMRALPLPGRSFRSPP